ncbi:MAG: ribonuclease HII [Chloroflexota bacterium]
MDTMQSPTKQNPTKQNPTKQKLPTLIYEQAEWAKGVQFIAGIDEVGRGSIAGPVVAAAVVLKPHSKQEGIWSQVRDSKLLSPAKRLDMVVEIQARACAWGIGSVGPDKIDEIGIAPATKLAMQAAIDALTPQPDFLLIDWVRLAQVNIAQMSIKKADSKIVSVAAASILAKVHRDALMDKLHSQYPAYAFDQNKGYGTAVHRAAIEAHGPCPEHRFSFAPIASERTLF